MGVGADHEVAGHHYALLGQQRMLNTHTALLKIVDDLMLMGKIARDLGLLGTLDVLVGRVMVGHEANPLAVKHSSTNLAHRLDGDGSRNVVGEHQVEVALNQLARHNLIESRVGGQNLLCHGHGTCHWVSSLVKSLAIRRKGRLCTRLFALF